MGIDSKYFIHKSDEAALKALKAIPGFTQVIKAFMKVFNERQLKVINLSSNVRISNDQLKKYYDMLPPICEKLGIAIPELYLELDPSPNAGTYGDTNPFIVMTTGLLETIPEYLVPTVLAHECGHIACHHSLYTTMGEMIFEGAIGILANVTDLILTPIKVPFYYWMRCSEFSADRAAIVCDGSADKTVELCMRLAGCDKDIIKDIDKDTFLQQAVEYQDFIKNDKLNKAMELYSLMYVDHPLTAIRAYEADIWGKSDNFKNIISGNFDAVKEETSKNKVNNKDDNKSNKFFSSLFG